MVDFSPIQRPPAGQILGAFREAVQKGDDVRVSVDGQDFKVIAQGQFTSSGGQSRSVAWVRDNVDTTGIFLQAMAQAYGPRISQEISNTLGLEPSPGKTLASRSITQALEMGEIGKQALSGVDFMTQLEHSASAGGRSFQLAMNEMQIDPRAMDSGTRQWIDEQMKLGFDAALASGNSPVSPETATGWLKQLIGGMSRTAD
jgi:hypothetical protein